MLIQMLHFPFSLERPYVLDEKENAYVSTYLVIDCNLKVPSYNLK